MTVPSPDLIAQARREVTALRASAGRLRSDPHASDLGKHQDALANLIEALIPTSLYEKPVRPATPPTPTATARGCPFCGGPGGEDGAGLRVGGPSPVEVTRALAVLAERPGNQRDPHHDDPSCDCIRCSCSRALGVLRLAAR